MDELPCIICGKELECAFSGEFGEEIKNQPYAGTVFTTHGHYGSTIFDPMQRPQDLEITVCDECLKKKKDKVYLVTTSYVPDKKDYNEWDPEEDLS